jgi:hypothetical protein
MYRTSTLSLLIFSILFAFSANSQTTYVDHGSYATYNLGSGDSLYIQNGTYTGNISTFSQNAKITVASGASFQPASFSNPKGIITVLGNAKFNSLTSNKFFDLENWGITQITGSASMIGGQQMWANYFGATLIFTGAVSMNSNAELVNDGTITGGSNFTMNSASKLTNNNLITITGAFSSNGGQLLNLGKLETGGLAFNSGTTFTNDCRLVINGDIDINNSSTITNDGLIWIPSQYSSASISNSGTINNTVNGKIRARNFNNFGTLIGKGYCYFTGTTFNSGTVGVSGITTDTIKIYDATRTSPPNIFDIQNGTVRPNVVFSSFPAPDTTFAYASCSMKYFSMMAILPVKWNFFYVNLSNNTPLLTWSSEQDAGTKFEIQRSYDGTNFSAIGIATSETGKTNYSYEDRTVNTQTAIVYYRIKAIELSGAEKFTETKLIRFNNKQGISVETVPNPFTNQFSINYQSEEKGTVVIKLYNMTGQLQATKNVSVSKGFNSISVTEAASLTKGIYMVQLNSDNKLIASEKIVKQ